ncbi:cytochrome c, class I [Novosphingobium resinovorum]|uniref:c-type cytochrome n=1 Tax=Novosphingobium resinovorum TaxID=158500 RepID=UPI002ED2545E|nr:cytochrome c, class I [Novosphingobium resinovorum]
MNFRHKRAGLAAAAALALVACLGGQAALTSTAEAAPAAPAAPPASFARCAVCHNVAKGAPNKLGPNLFGTYGHKMGQGKFAFSDAVKKSGLTLDDATLDKWLENPRTLVPGNRMSFPGLKDAAKRKEIIDYLKKQR